MPRLFLHLAFRGTAYRGWQRQAAGIPTVQQTIEDALIKLFGYKIHVAGCGRTDAGVHARAYYAHLDVHELPKFNLLEKLNLALPPDICIKRVYEVHARAHAQRDALSRSYCYEIDLEKAPFRVGLAGRYDKLKLDVELMQRVVKLYAEAQDFGGFCRSPAKYSSTHCRIDACTLTPVASPRGLRFDITADRFLHNMVRLLVARMIDVGRGALTLADIRHSLATGEAPKYLEPAYADGLYLEEVKYQGLGI